MISQKNIFRLTFIFSILINIFLVGLLLFVIKDSLSGVGELALPIKKMFYVTLVILGFTILNGIWFKSIKKINH